MRHGNRWMIVLLLIACLQLAACTQKAAEGASKSKIEPAKVEHNEATGLGRITLTAQAAKRLGIQTAKVGDAKVGGKQRKVIPYAAVIYDPKGAAWAYTNPEPLVFVRHSISIDEIRGNQAVLSAGPPSGTAVVVVGAAELFGTEVGIGGGH